MNELALIKIHSKLEVLDREFEKAIKNLIQGSSSLSDEKLEVIVNSTEREILIYEYILKLIINDSNVN